MSLEHLKLPEYGLVVFGARPGMGLTITTILLGNQLASHRNVGFVTYHNYKEKLQAVLLKLTIQQRSSLQIDLSLPYYDINFNRHLSSLIHHLQIDVVILDDLDSLMAEAELEQHERNTFITKLCELASERKILILLNLYVSTKADWRSGDKVPALRDFNWSRNLIETADQLYSIYRPEYYCIVQDENGLSTRNRLDVSLLKDKTGEFDLSNRERSFSFQLIK